MTQRGVPRPAKPIALTGSSVSDDPRGRPAGRGASPQGCQPRPNFLRFRLGTDDGVTVCVQAKEPGERLVSRPVELEVDFGRVFGARQEAYQRLLGDALVGNPARFARQDGVEHAWRVIQPLLDHPGPVHRYERGSWGPAEAETVVAGHGGWHDPVPGRA